MAGPNSQISELAATTYDGYSGVLADNVTKGLALLRQLDKKGNKQVATGNLIVQELEYAENSTAGWFSGSELFDVSASDVLSAARFDYKQAIGSVSISGLDEIKNSGKEQIHNFMKAKVKNLDRSLKNLLGRALYADGTGSGGKELGGLRFLVADVPTNTVGGISGATTLFNWQNYVYGFAANSATPSSTTIQHAMNLTDINTSRGTDKADIITTDKIFYTFYLESLQVNQMFTDDKNAGAGFTNLMYGGRVPVIYDDVCPASHMYFLNTDFIFLRPAKGKEFERMTTREPVNQDVMVMPVQWAGNMTINNRSLQGVITA